MVVNSVDPDEMPQNILVYKVYRRLGINGLKNKQ